MSHQLPKLPTPSPVFGIGAFYSADQMRAYAELALTDQAEEVLRLETLLADKTVESADLAHKLRLASVKREPQWLPIESAPKEWGSYLVWHEKYGIETLWYQLKDGGLDGRLAGNWYSEDEMGDSYSRNYRVTHWMPLPPPPVTATTASSDKETE